MPDTDVKNKESQTLYSQEVYKYSRELAAANKTLTLLRELYKITLLSLDPVAVATQVSTLMRDSLRLEMVGIFIFNHKEDAFLPLAFTKSSRLISILRKLDFLFSEITISGVTKRPVFKNLFEGEPVIVTSISDIWGGLVNDEDLKTITESANLKTTLIYPLLTEEKIIGAILLSYNSSYDQISAYEKESLKSFTDAIAVSLDKSYTYKELTTANKNLTAINKEMEVANEKLKTVDETKSSILSFAQHYLQNPIADIVMASSMLADGSFGETNPKVVKASTQLFESARHLSLTVKMWLRALDFEENRITYTMTSFDLAEMVERITKDWVVIAKDRGLDFSFETDNKPPYTIKADQTWIYEVIVNLVDNAFKMTKEGFIKLKVEKVGIEKIRFSISDSGVGIDAETLSKLFQKFERGHEGWKNNVEGTGLGLYISKKIVTEGHKGKIWAESKGLGGGATFFVELAV